MDQENTEQSAVANTGVGYWIIVGLLSLWAVMGIFAYMGTVSLTPALLIEQVDAGIYTREYADLLLNSPAWHTALFAIAIFSGVLGAICLLLRRKWAVPLYALSFLCVIISMIKSFVLDKAASFMSGTQIGMEVFIIILSLFAVWFSRSRAVKGILK